MNKNKLIEKIGDLSHKRYMSGVQVGVDKGQEEITKRLKEKAGLFFSDGNDEKAQLYRTLAVEISKMQFEKDVSYHQTSELYQEIEDAIEAKYGFADEQAVDAPESA